MVCFLPLAAECSGKRKRHKYISQEQPQEEDEDKSAEQKKSKLHNVWENVDLILTLQNKELQVERKIKAAFDFVSCEVNASDVKLQLVSLSRALCYVFDWVESLLISSCQNRRGSNPWDPCLDYRCWDIIKFCLEKSSPGVSPNLLRAVTGVLNQAAFLLDVDSSLDGEESVLLFENVLGFLSSLLSSNSRAFYNVGVDLWISCAAGVLNLVSRVSSGEERPSSLAKVHLDLSTLLLEQFASFLRFHPSPKNIFRVFVDRLLEPLFEVLVLLQVRTKDRQHMGGMLSLVEGVLSNGIFHPSHICGFLNSRNSVVNLLRGTKGANESYHRHLFRKLEGLVGEKKVAVFGGLACLFRLFVSKSKGLQGAYFSVKYQALKKGNEACEGKIPLFEVFMQFMEPLLHESKCRAEKELSELTVASEDGLIELHCVLRSVNQTLESCIQEKIYVRNEDTAEGNHLPNISNMGVKPSSLLVNVVFKLGCNLIKVYAELRQVNIPLFALCKAVRFLVNSSNMTGVYNLSPSTYLSSQSCLKAAKALLCSPELRSTIVNAVKSVPEGQVGSFIQLLNTDIADTLEWMRQSSLPLAKIKMKIIVQMCAF
ncbi:hypothetical protein HPP92_020638 [Vanilla planifolia]|uniref:Uncharacterized protein n=1 Tax=Vanilla planifolia TaxID=51239 RepID=A0A835PTZ8_VANPL|nr:hypothetical protein HPP92_020638 [Vanilla planifolia]